MTPQRTKTTAISLLAAAVLGGTGVAIALVLSGDAAAVDDKTIFCSEYVPNAQAESNYAKWLTQNSGEKSRWELFRDAICAGQNPVPPTMTTAKGRGLVAAGKMALPESPPPPTTTTGTTTSTTTTTTTAPPPSTCTDTYASGTLAAFIGTLASGDIGCAAGTFTENIKIDRTGGITLRSTPGQVLTLRGYLWVTRLGNDWTFRDFNIHQPAVTSPNTVQVQGDRLTFSGMNITNFNKPGSGFNGICLLAGAGFEGNSADTVIDLVVEKSRIYDCGDDAHEHSLYLESTRNAQVRDNFLYGNGGYAIHMYPDAQGSLIEHNVMSDNSEDCKANLTFSGQGPPEYNSAHGSSNNLVTRNLITFPVCRYNVESYYPSSALLGVGNVVEFNCVFGAPGGNFGTSTPGRVGYTEHDNLNLDPLYVNRAARNYALQAGSPCIGKGPR